MRFNRKQGEFLGDVIDSWRADGVVDPETADRLEKSFVIRPFDWARLAKYSFVIAVICAAIGLCTMFADKELLALIERIIDAPDNVLLAFFSSVSAIFFFFGIRKSRKNPHHKFGNEALLLFGVLFAAMAIAFLGRILDSGSGHFSLLLLLAAALYGVIGVLGGSGLVWVCALLALGGWYGAETGYVSGWGAYYFGMNYPLRFLLFGAILALIGLSLKKSPVAAFLHRPTYTVGLLYLFVSLWILSIFGNYGDMHAWHRSTHMELFRWSVVFGLVAIAAIWYGLRYDDGAARGFGIVFLLINLYTKFFEYFWSDMHKAVFFLILAVSFWLIGWKAEKIWNLEFVKKTLPRGDKIEN